MDPFRGARIRENTMKTKGFGSKSALRGVTFLVCFWVQMGPFSGPPLSEMHLEPAENLENPMGGVIPRAKRGPKSGPKVTQKWSPSGEAG